jgi:hypothetical protein
MPANVAELKTSMKHNINSGSRYNSELSATRHCFCETPIGDANPHSSLNNFGTNPVDQFHEREPFRIARIIAKLLFLPAESKNADHYKHMSASRIIADNSLLYCAQKNKTNFRQNFLAGNEIMLSIIA